MKGRRHGDGDKHRHPTAQPLYLPFFVHISYDITLKPNVKVELEAKTREGRDVKGRAGGRQLLICASTSLPWQYFSRRAGFSIFPVGLRGTRSKMIRRGRL